MFKHYTMRKPIFKIVFKKRDIVYLRNTVIYAKQAFFQVRIRIEFLSKNHGYSAVKLLCCVLIARYRFVFSITKRMGSTDLYIRCM